MNARLALEDEPGLLQLLLQLLRECDSPEVLESIVAVLTALEADEAAAAVAQVCHICWFHDRICETLVVQK